MSTRVILVDFISSSSSQQDSHKTDSHFQLYQLLKNKFTHQQCNRVKYCQNQSKQHFHYFPIEFVHDQEFLIENSILAHFLPSPLKSDRNFILKAVKKSAAVIRLIDIDLFSDREFILQIIETNAYSFRYIPSKYTQHDRQIVMEAVKRKGHMLEYASNEFKDDLDIVLAAVKNVTHYHALRFVSKRLRNDKNVIITSVERCGMSLAYASTRLRSDKRVVLKAVQQDGRALQYSTRKDDRDITLMAIRNDGCALFYASDKYRDDKTIVLEAMNNNVQSLAYASERVKNELVEYSDEREFILKLIREYKCPLALACASDRLRNDRQLVMEAIQFTELPFSYISNELKLDPDIVLKSILHGGGSAMLGIRDCTLFDCVEFQERILNEIIPHYTFMCTHALPKRLLNNEKFIMRAVEINGLFLKHVPQTLMSENLVLKALKQNVKAIEFASPFNNRKDIILSCVKQDGLLLSHAHSDLKMDYQVIMEAVKQNGSALQFSLMYSIPIEIEQEAVKQCGYFINYTPQLYQLRMDSCYNDMKMI